MASGPYRCSCLTRAFLSRERQRCVCKERNERILEGPERQGYQASPATLPGRLSHWNQTDQNQELVSVDLLDNHLVSYISHPGALEWPTCHGTNFCQPREIATGPTKQDTASILSPNSVEYGLQTNFRSSKATALDMCLDDVFNSTEKSNGIDPVGVWGGWLENTDYFSQPQAQIHEVSPLNELVEAPYSANHFLPLYPNNPEQFELELDHSIPFTENNYLPESQYLFPPPMTIPQPWDVFNTVDGNFGAKESEYLNTSTGTPCMNKNAKDQTISQSPSAYPDIRSQPSTIIPLADFSLGLGPEDSSKLTPQKMYALILPKPNDTLVKSTNPSSISPSGIGDSETTKWDNPTSFEHRCNLSNGPMTQRGAGRRRGPLNPATKKRTHKMRALGACWRCRMLKVTCSEGDICAHCRKLKLTSLNPSPCTRKNLGDYRGLFFPRILSSHLRKPAIELLTDELSLGFVENDIEADLTYDYGGIPMKLVVTEFVPVDHERSYIPALTCKADDRAVIYANRQPSPVALRDEAMSTLTDNCRSYMKSMVVEKRDLSGLRPRTTNKIPKMLFEAVCKYHESDSLNRNTALLDKAMTLYSLHYLMGETIFFTDASAQKIASSLRYPVSPLCDKYLLSRLLNRQVKSVMHTILCELTGEVLEELERYLNAKSKASWATSFCVVSILCICMEDVQIAMNGFGMHTRRYGAKADIPSARESIEVCQLLDAKLFTYAVELFHTVYKTRKLSSVNKKNHVYNPIRDAPEINYAEGLDSESADLANAAREIVFNLSTELIERSKIPSFDSGLRGLDPYMEFRESNSGRLASMFLRSFLTSDVRS